MRRITTLLIVGLIVGTLVLASVGVGYLGGYFDRIPFDAAEWKAQEDGKWIRRRMVDDLLRRHRLVGMRRAEVQALLGPPREYSNESSYECVLRPYPDAFDFDWEVLQITFAGDTVTAARVCH
jgi:hypothetical protein